MMKFIKRQFVRAGEIILIPYKYTLVDKQDDNFVISIVKLFLIIILALFALLWAVLIIPLIPIILILLSDKY